MSSWQNYLDKVRRYFPFSRSEWNSFLVLVFVFAFMWSFTQWGEAEFDVAAGLRNLVIALVMVSIAVFAHHAGQRLTGLWFGYRIEHKVWWTGLLVGLLALVLSNGRVFIFAASAMQAHFMPVHRLGAWRFGPSLRQIGTTAFMGPIACVIVALLLALLIPLPFFNDLLNFSLLFSLYSMLPLPPLDGLHVFVGSRTTYGGSFTYTFAVSGFLGFFLVYFLTGIGFWWSLASAVVIGLFGWFAFDVLVERGGR